MKPKVIWATNVVKILLFFACFVLFGFESHGQSGMSKIDKKDLKRYVNILSADAGRQRNWN
jgi:hypothetical protein